MVCGIHWVSSSGVSVSISSVIELYSLLLLSSLSSLSDPQQTINFVRQKILKSGGSGSGGGSDGSGSLQEVARLLCREALARGSVDNITVLIVSFHLGSGSGGGSATASSSNSSSSSSGGATTSTITRPAPPPLPLEEK